MLRRRGHIFCVEKILRSMDIDINDAHAHSRKRVAVATNISLQKLRFEFGVFGQQDRRRESGISLFKEEGSNY